MVAVSVEFCKNEPVAHGKYWMCPGSLICCTLYHQPERVSIGSNDTHNYSLLLLSSKV
jgi:hypothetical protein